MTEPLADGLYLIDTRRMADGSWSTDVFDTRFKPPVLWAWRQGFRSQAAAEAWGQRQPPPPLS